MVPLKPMEAFLSVLLYGKVGVNMDKENKLAQRKHPRLDKYDYSASGGYFITICTEKRKCTLSRVVGRGLAPAEADSVEYTLWGRIAEEQLLRLEERYHHLTIDKYVVMPNHIHAIMIIKPETAGAGPRSTIMDMICTYKSLTIRECRRYGFEGKLFQTSFYEDRKSVV